MPGGNSQKVRCSFCSKPQMDVLTIVAGPEAYICDECIAICNDVISQMTSDAPGVLAAFESKHFGPLVRCRMCHSTSEKSQATAFLGRGWLCAVCVEAVRAQLGLARGGQG
jgi:hypothetical protein